MLFRYRAVLALTLAAACTLPASAQGAAGRRHHRHTRTHAAGSPEASAIYSARALRRARIILQLKLLELRAERLERVRKALERNLPVDQLIQEP